MDEYQTEKSLEKDLVRMFQQDSLKVILANLPRLKRAHLKLKVDRLKYELDTAKAQLAEADVDALKIAKLDYNQV